VSAPRPIADQRNKASASIEPLPWVEPKTTDATEAGAKLLANRNKATQDRARNPQAGKAPVPPDGPGHRRLQHDRRRRPRHGLHVRRQGQLRHARHPAQDAAARADQLRDRGGQPRPEAARLSRPHPARVPDEPGRGVPHRDAGHLLHRQAQHPRRQDHVQPVQPLAPGHSVQRGATSSSATNSRWATTATTCCRRSS